jgi:hypothetical protein
MPRITKLCSKVLAGAPLMMRNSVTMALSITIAAKHHSITVPQVVMADFAIDRFEVADSMVAVVSMDVV